MKLEIVCLFEHISESLPFGQMGRKQLKKFGGEMGIEIVADETYGPSDTNMTAQLKKIADSGAQAVVNWSIVPAQSIVPKDMKALGMKIPLFQSHGFGNIKYIEAAGDSGRGNHVSSWPPAFDQLVTSGPLPEKRSYGTTSLTTRAGTGRMSALSVGMPTMP